MAQRRDCSERWPTVVRDRLDSVCCDAGFSGLDGSAQVHCKGVVVNSVMLTTAITKQMSGYPGTSLVVSDEPRINLTDTISPLIQNLTGAIAPVEKLLEVDLNDKFGVVLAMGEPIISNLDEAGFKHIQALFSTARGILWVSRGARSLKPDTNMFLGFARSIRTENKGLRIVTLDLDDQNRLPDDQACDTILKVFKLTFGPDSPKFVADTEFFEVEGVLQIHRMISNKSKDDYVVRETQAPVPIAQPFGQQGRPLELSIGQPGQLDSLHFQDHVSLQKDLREDEVQVSVKSVGMNFKDIMIALGQIPFYHNIGIDCSGIVTAVGSNVTDLYPGNRVCAMAHGAYANVVRVPQHRVAQIPDSLGFTEAATLPVVFCTAYYALNDVARLCGGETILIHAAAGGIGQAAIMLAQNLKAEMFATVGSLEKKDLIMRTFNISENHIFSSRDTSFRQELMTLTNQKGVDVVLNSTTDDILR